VAYAFTMPGASSPVAADTKCHVWITHGWLIGLDRSIGENLYEIELGANRRDIRDVDISLEKGDLAPPITVSRFDWQRQPDGTFASRVYALSAGELVGSLRLENADVGGQTLVCTPFTIVTWDHSAGRLGLGTPPTIPPASAPEQPNRVAIAAAFERKAWPTYQQTVTGDSSGGITILAVNVDAAGRPTTTDVFRSSGSDALDSAAVDAAMRSMFRATGSPATYIAWYVFRPTLTMGEYLP
jgi:TonB family protein